MRDITEIAPSLKNTGAHIEGVATAGQSEEHFERLAEADELTLSGGIGDYAWTIDGQSYPDADPLEVREGEWVRFVMRNRSMMWHPMHLHGHFFQVENGTGRGPFKDTVLVEPHMGEVTFDFVADNPGEWLFHCHNAYHLEAGMACVVSYER